MRSAATLTRGRKTGQAGRDVRNGWGMCPPERVRSNDELVQRDQTCCGRCVRFWSIHRRAFAGTMSRSLACDHTHWAGQPCQEAGVCNSHANRWRAIKGRNQLATGEGCLDESELSANPNRSPPLDPP